MKKGRTTRSICIYCGGPAGSSDHVPPKSFLERPFPINLKTVPACISCNNGFSKDEDYFLIALSQISTSPSLTAKIEEGGSIYRALEKSPLLDDRLTSSLSVDAEGRVLIRLEIERIHLIIKKIALGLYALRYGRVPSLRQVDEVAAYPYSVRDDRPALHFISTVTEKFRSKRWLRVQKDVFSYIFIRDSGCRDRISCIMDFHSTLWGVVRFTRPQLVDARMDGQMWLFPR